MGHLIENSLRRRIGHEVFDYQVLCDCLACFSRPRDKITGLLRSGVICRVKKGLYLFGEDYRRRPFSRELIANLAYGPSYVSLQYAMWYHGLIPERVQTVTSVTCGRSRRFVTPVGNLTYKSISMEAFRGGMDRIELPDGESFLMATPEKALADTVAAARGAAAASQREMSVYLLENLRIDEAVLRGLDPARLEDAARRYRSRQVRLVAGVVSQLQRRREGV